MSSADLANYGLVPADLCDASGAHCVSLNSASVSAGLAGAKADSSGLLHVDPATVPSGAYPLISVTYAAVRTTQEPTALTDFAALINFAAGQGQTAGVEPGQLPHGYLPLSDGLRAAARTAATRLLAAASPTPTATPPGGAPTQPNSNSNSNANSGPVAAVTPAAGASPSSLPYSTTQASPAAATNTTAPTPMGAVRWALIAVVAAGVAGAIGGPLLRVASGGRATPWRPE